MRDVTLDKVLMKFLVRGEVPFKRADKLRVKRAAKFLRVDDRGVLCAKHPGMGVDRYIPPVCKWEDHIKEALKGMGFPNGIKLVET